MILLVALVLDAVLGEPDAMWSRVRHPAIAMGNTIAWFDARWNRGHARRGRGVAMVLVHVIGATALGLLIQALPLAPVWTGLAAASLLAQRSLCDHVAAVGDALRLSTEDGRMMVARIVGRDTAHMDQSAVARAAIESAAENLSDGVIAPAFWFLLAGLPGLLVYKVINTADSMVGYRTLRHAEFGWASARLDDLLNLVPARLTALTIAALSGGLSAWSDIRAEARRHRSPNAGWPEAAASRALGVALSGPRHYNGQLEDFPFVNPDGHRNLGPSDVDNAVALLWRVWWVLLATTLLIVLAS
ncbi:MAG: adenosylcobinamide-phosphate synthase CbiB [Pseudomonadota bacterium]